MRIRDWSSDVCASDLLVHENEFRTMMGKFTYEFPRRRPVALFHGHVVELHEVVDQRTLFIGHHVLQRAAGSLAIDIHSAQPSLAGIGPDRRLRAVDPLIVFARADRKSVV